jgi:hypothetical protein
LNADAINKAWEELYIAEGSDWFWWYGDDHSSGNDGAFDSLFRTHLKNVYTFIGAQPPSFLNIPVKGMAHARRYTLPQVSLSVHIDGQITNYFEWLGAGRYRPDKEGGVMTAAQASLVDQIFFGYDKKNLCVRIDLRSGANPAVHDAPDNRSAAPHQIKGIALRFTAPQGLSMTIEPPLPTDPQGGVTLDFEGPWRDGGDAEIAWRDVLELAIPLSLMGVAPGQEIGFYIEVVAPDRPTERYPRSCSLDFAAPAENAHEHEWMV